MTLGFVIKVVGGVFALLLGVWFGMPGRYTQTPDEIDEVMASGMGRRKKTKRYFTPMAWMRRQISVRPRAAMRGGGRGFRIESPDDR